MKIGKSRGVYFSSSDSLLIILVDKRRLVDRLELGKITVEFLLCADFKPMPEEKRSCTDVGVLLSISAASVRTSADSKLTFSMHDLSATFPVQLPLVFAIARCISAGRSRSTCFISIESTSNHPTVHTVFLIISSKVCIEFIPAQIVKSIKFQRGTKHTTECCLCNL